MKTSAVIFSLSALLIFFSSCTPENCKNAFNLCDLLINDKTLALVTSDSTGDTYQIVHTVLNSAENIACNKEKRECDAVANSTSNTFDEHIFYNLSSPSPSNWGAAVDSFASSVNTLTGCQDADVEDYLQFLQDGYYLIVATIDFFDEVNERNEGNNTEETGSGKQEIQRMIVKVDRGLVATETRDGAPVLVKRIKSTVTYH